MYTLSVEKLWKCCNSLNIAFIKNYQEAKNKGTSFSEIH